MEHEIFNFNDRNESIVSWETCDFVINTTPRYALLRRVQMSKIIQIDKIAKTVMQKYPNCVRLDGMTRNPPIEDMKKETIFYEKAERRRDPGEPRQNIFFSENPLNNLYQPFINVDKKFVADIYKQNGLMDTLFPIARSCVGTENVTDNYTRECHSCFWCYEKKWAFNLTW
jgi:hypothetical protein